MSLRSVLTRASAVILLTTHFRFTQYVVLTRLKKLFSWPEGNKEIRCKLYELHIEKNLVCMYCSYEPIPDTDDGQFRLSGVSSNSKVKCISLWVLLWVVKVLPDIAAAQKIPLTKNISSPVLPLTSIFLVNLI